MANGDFKKPVRERQYVKSGPEQSNSSIEEEVGFSEAEADHQFKLEAAHAQGDYSVKGDAELSDAELLKRFRVSLTSSILPNAPAIPGFHLCWVPENSNNHYDTVDFRKQVGYTVVKPEEVPQFSSASNRSAQYEGCVSHNELILMKIPTRIYNIFMRDAHHHQPNEQERTIKQAISAMEDKDGNNIARDENEMTGINKLARKVAEPKFS